MVAPSATDGLLLRSSYLAYPPRISRPFGVSDGSIGARMRRSLASKLLVGCLALSSLVLAQGKKPVVRAKPKPKPAAVAPKAPEAAEEKAKPAADERPRPRRPRRLLLPRKRAPKRPPSRRRRTSQTEASQLAAQSPSRRVPRRRRRCDARRSRQDPRRHRRAARARGGHRRHALQEPHRAPRRDARRPRQDRQAGRQPRRWHRVHGPARFFRRGRDHHLRSRRRARAPRARRRRRPARRSRRHLPHRPASRVTLEVPENQRLEATIRIDDDSDMGSDFPSSQKGSYDLRVRVRAKARKVTMREVPARESCACRRRSFWSLPRRSRRVPSPRRPSIPPAAPAEDAPPRPRAPLRPRRRAGGPDTRSAAMAAYNRALAERRLETRAAHSRDAPRAAARGAGALRGAGGATR